MRKRWRLSVVKGVPGASDIRRPSSLGGEDPEGARPSLDSGLSCRHLRSCAESLLGMKVFKFCSCDRGGESCAWKISCANRMLARTRSKAQSNEAGSPCSLTVAGSGSWLSYSCQRSTVSRKPCRSVTACLQNAFVCRLCGWRSESSQAATGADLEQDGR